MLEIDCTSSCYFTCRYSFSYLVILFSFRNLQFQCRTLQCQRTQWDTMMQRKSEMLHVNEYLHARQGKHVSIILKIHHFRSKKLCQIVSVNITSRCFTYSQQCTYIWCICKSIPFVPVSTLIILKTDTSFIAENENKRQNTSKN